MRSLFRANWRCLYPRAGGGGHPEAHPLLSYTFRNDVLLFYALAAGLSPLLLPLTFELNIPSSPWTGIFYTSPNVVFVYVSRVPRGTRVYGLCYGASSFEEGEVNSFWRMSLVFFFFFCSNMGRRVFGKFWFFEFSNSTTFSLVKETIRKDKFYEWFRYTRRARCSNRVSHVGCSKFGNTCPDNGSG